MTVEGFRGYIAALVAAICVIGGAIGAAWAWAQTGTGDVPRDLALILSVFTGLIASGSTFLFVQEGASRASHAALTAHAAGVAAMTETELVPPAPPPPADPIAPEPTAGAE